jgi:hypothetical protein
MVTMMGVFLILFFHVDTGWQRRTTCYLPRYTVVISRILGETKQDGIRSGVGVIC